MECLLCHSLMFLAILGENVDYRKAPQVSQQKAIANERGPTFACANPECVNVAFGRSEIS